MTTEDASNLPPIPSGVVAGKYELVQLIGRGGMGSVWEGRHKTLGTRVAIKFIDVEYANSQDARNRFDNEARAAATIQSKHAIQVYDHGLLEDGRPYIVMELLIGEPLDQRIKGAARLALPEIARIVQQVSRALGRAHERGIIHRDLKPENIFLVRHPDDEDEVAKVLDFGIAKIRTTPGAIGISSSTKTGTLLGTPFYMSPEQARGLRNVDHRSDLWSLAVIVFRCATGVLPFDGESLGDLLVKICTAPIPMPSHLIPNLPPTLDAWMARALEREPEQRFQTAAELTEHLAMAVGVSYKRPPSSATPMGGGYGRTPSNRPPGVVQAPLSSSQGVVPPMPSSAFGMPIPPATSAPITASTSSDLKIPTTSRRATLIVAMTLGLALGIGGVFVYRAHASSADAAQGVGLAQSAVPSAPQPESALPAAAALGAPSAGQSAEAVPVATLEPASPQPPPTTSASTPAPTHGKKSTKSKSGASPNTGGATNPPPTPPPKPPINTGDPGY